MGSNITLGEPRSFGLPKLLGGYHLRQSEDDNSTSPEEEQIKEEKIYG